MPTPTSEEDEEEEEEGGDLPRSYMHMPALTHSQT